ncbi:hypothetical protein DFS34DRAFT_274252 [Phlyctochytrium arcticum]|nr:hypothetical protein DFS34DRAFT_274252 [Phlyctochytrium arcticum]
MRPDRWLTQCSTICILWACLVIILPLASVYAQAATCICDLTSNLCDPNCCCDPDCSSAARASYFRGECLPESGLVSEVPVGGASAGSVCHASAALNNVAAVLSQGGDQCVSVREGSVRKFALPSPSTYTTAGTFQNIFQQAPYSYSSTASTPQSLPRTAYKYGDIIQVAFPGPPALRTALRLPVARISSLCEDTSPARFLKAQNSACARALNSNGTQCTAGTAFDYRYYSALSVIANPVNGSTVAIGATCVNAAGATITCANPTFNPVTQNCDNAVSLISYVITYAVSSPEVTTIVDIKMQATLSSQDARTGSIEQRFTATFALVSLSGGTTPAVRSGNSGYVFGRPVLAGTRSGGTISVQASGLSIPQNIYDAGTGRITCGSPTNPAARLPVTFGTNVATGCTLHLALADLAAGCTALATTIYNIQTQSLMGISHVGRTGSSGSALDDWLTVINALPVGTPVSSADDSSCSNLLTNVNIEFLIADVGISTSPQPNIIGARFRPTLGSFSWSCANVIDCLSSTQPFHIASTVTFLYVRGPPEMVLPPPPQLVKGLPDDIFYPFQIASYGLRSRPACTISWFIGSTALAIVSILWAL